MKNQRLKGKIVSVYLDKISRIRLEALSAEMSLSRSAILRVLVAEKWRERADRCISAVERFDAAKTKREMELIQAGVDPAEAWRFMPQ